MDSAGDSDALRFQVDLRPHQRRMLRHLWIAGGSMAALLGLKLLGATLSPAYGMVLGLYLVVAGTMAVLALRLPAHGIVAVGSSGLSLPAAWHWRGERRVALGDIRQIVRAPVQGRPTLFVGVLRQLAVTLPLAQFASEDEATRFVDALRFRARVPVQDYRLDYGTTRLALCAVAVLVAAHLLRDAVAGSSLAAVLEWGALNRTLVLEGQWYRLLTHVLVQPDVVVLALHALALHRLLPGLQRNLGSAGISLVLVCATAAAGLGALSWADGNVAIGAAGPLYGLVGAIAWLRLSEPARIPPAAWTLPAWLWVGWLVLDCMLALAPGMVGVPLRAFGFAAGCASMGLLEWCERRARTVLPWLGMAAIVLCALAVGRWVFARVEAPGAEALALEIVSSERASLDDANLGGWVLATAPGADLPSLVRARELLAAHLQGASDSEGEKRDTLATLAYRLGDYGTAVELEAHVQREAAQAVYATQLARFARAAGAAARAGDVQVDREGTKVCVQALTAGPLDVDLIALRGGRIEGLLQFSGVTQRACSNAPLPAPADVRFEPGRVAPAWRPGALNVSYWAADPETLALP